jgi:hypothetical protein
LEEHVGRKRFDPFLRSWFDENAFQSRTTMDFEKALREQLFPDQEGQMESLGVAEWLYGTGLPENAPEPRSDAFIKVDQELKSFLDGQKSAEDLPGSEWSTHEWRHMLTALPEKLPIEKMADLDEAWSLSETGNSEVLAKWLERAITTGYEKAYPSLERFLTEQGRRKFLKPLYTRLAGTPEGRERGLAIYAKARPLYHAISSNTIDEILGYQAP